MEQGADEELRNAEREWRKLETGLTKSLVQRGAVRTTPTVATLTRDLFPIQRTRFPGLLETILRSIDRKSYF